MHRNPPQSQRFCDVTECLERMCAPAPETSLLAMFTKRVSTEKRVPQQNMSSRSAVSGLEHSPRDPHVNNVFPNRISANQGVSKHSHILSHACTCVPNQATNMPHTSKHTHMCPHIPIHLPSPLQFCTERSKHTQMRYDR